MFFGKIVGFLAGFLLLGPVGSLFGLWIGHQFDRGLQLPHYGSPFGRAPSEAANTFFAATFSVMGHISKSDGHVSKNEIELAEQVMRNLGLTEAARQLAIQFFQQGKESSFDLLKTLEKLRHDAHNHQALLQLFVDIQSQVVTRDGYSKEKEKIMQFICQQLRVQPFSGANFQYSSHSQQRANPFAKPQGPNPYTVLGMDPGATDSEIKRAYRKLMSQNHPDKLVSKGLPADMIKLATEKTQQIQAAYEKIRRERGIA